MIQVRDESVVNNNNAANNNINDDDRNVSIEIQYSPDLLFMRSILRIYKPSNNDFGPYNCIISNSMGNDSMQINLKRIESKGKSH